MIGAAAIFTPHGSNAPFLLSNGTSSHPPTFFLPKRSDLTFSKALKLQHDQSLAQLEHHVFPTGAIVAAYHPVEYCNVWRRDAALIALRLTIKSAPDDPGALSRIASRANFNESFRQEASRFHHRGRLSVARVSSEGRVRDLKWQDPQHDGSPLEVFLESVEGLRVNGKDPELTQRLHRGVTEEAEHAIAHIDKPHYDLWEELIAERHFWTTTAENVGYFAASLFCAVLGKRAQAERYAVEHRKSIDRMMDFLKDTQNGWIFPHWHVKSKVEGSLIEKAMPHRDAHIMSALLLAHEAAEHLDGYRQPIPITDSYALKAVGANIQSSLGFDINKGAQLADGILIGRYPWDRYGGPHDLYGGGNLWPLLTFDFGNYLSRMGIDFLNQGKIDATGAGHEALKSILHNPALELPKEIIPASSPVFWEVIQTLSDRADAQGAAVLKRTMFSYSDDPDDSRNFWIPEQLHGRSGKPHGGVWNLAWSHAAFLAYYDTRQQLQEILARKIAA